jgi:hypothetical protein
MPVGQIYFKKDIAANKIPQCWWITCFKGETDMRDTSSIGEVSRWQIIAALTRRGKQLLLPIGDHLRYDLAIDDEGRLLRVQCKTGRLRNGVVSFLPCSIDSRSKRGGCVCRSYRGEIELFGVYCPQNRKCYLVPVEDVPQFGCHLRIAPPRNGQKTRIHWAEDYEIE